MLVWLVIAGLALVIVFLVWGYKYWVEFKLYMANRELFHAVEGAQKIVGDVVGVAGEIKGVAEALQHGKGSLWSRAIGAFDVGVG